MGIKNVTLSMGDVEGVNIWPASQFTDIRGSLFKVVGSNVFQDFQAKEIFFTNSHKNTVRGMHFQIGAHPVNKVVSVIAGSVSDFLVDVRPDSPTFLNVLNIELKSSDKNVVYIPSGIAHGYVVHEENTLVMYLYDNDFCRDCDLGFNISSIPLIDRQKPTYIQSTRDLELPNIEKFLLDTYAL